MAQNFLLFSSAGRKKMAELALIVIMMSSLFESGGCRSADDKTSDLLKVNGSKESVEEISTSLGSKLDLSHKNDSLVPNFFQVVNDVYNLDFDEIFTNLFKAFNRIYSDVIKQENLEIFSIAETIANSTLFSLIGNYILAVYSYAVEYIHSNAKLLFAEFGFCINNNLTDIAVFSTCNGYLKDMVRVSQP